MMTENYLNFRIGTNWEFQIRFVEVKLQLEESWEWWFLGEYHNSLKRETDEWMSAQIDLPLIKKTGKELEVDLLHKFRHEWEFDLAKFEEPNPTVVNPVDLNNQSVNLHPFY